MGLFKKKPKKEQETVAPAQSVAPEMNAAPGVAIEQPTAPAAPDFSSQLGVPESGPNQITEIQATPAPAELVPESPSMGLMENDPFTENSGVNAGEIESTTGAQVEEPNPILEQQIALDVNIEEVIENGTTKEDEITKIVADNVAATAVAQTITAPTPEVSAPVAAAPAAPAEVPAPTPEVAPAPEAVPAPQIDAAPAEQPVLTLEPVPIQEAQPGLPVAEPVPAPDATAPVVEQPVAAAPEAAPEVTQAPEAVPAPQIDAAPTPEAVPAPQIDAAPTPEAVPAPQIDAAPTEEPAVTLEPGPIQEAQPGLPVAQPVPAPDATAPVVEQPVPAPDVTAPVVEQPVAAAPEATPEVTQAPASAPAPQIDAAPTEQPVLTLEPGPITESTGLPVAEPVPAQDVAPTVETTPAPEVPANPFTGVEAPTVTENEIVAPTMDLAEQQMQNMATQQEVQATPAPEQPVLTLEPGPIMAPTEPSSQEVHDLSKFFVEKDGVMVSQVNPNAEIPTTLAPQEQPVPTEEPTPANLNIDIQNPITETPEVGKPTVETPQTEGTEQPAQTEESSTTEEKNEDTMGQPEEPKVNEDLIPKPIVAPLVKEEEEVPPTQTAIAPQADKKIIVQSESLGRVQPVAPIAVLDNNPQEEDLSLTQRLSKITQEEHNANIGVEVTSISESEPTIVEDDKEEPVVITPTEPVKEQEESVPVKEETVEMPQLVEENSKETPEEPKTNIDVEKELYTAVDKVPEKMSRNSRRKILRGQEKFSAKEKIITEPIEEKKGLIFCESCGNVVSSADVICPSCGDPVK